MRTRLDQIVEAAQLDGAEFEWDSRKLGLRIADLAFRHGVERLHEEGCQPKCTWKHDLFSVQPAPAEEKLPGCHCGTKVPLFCDCGSGKFGKAADRRKGGERRSGLEQVHAGAYQHIFGGAWAWSERKQDRSLHNESYGDRRKKP